MLPSKVVASPSSLLSVASKRNLPTMFTCTSRIVVKDSPGASWAMLASVTPEDKTLIFFAS